MQIIIPFPIPYAHNFSGFSPNSGDSSDEIDQGQVAEGSKCGEDRVCDLKRCMTLTSLGLPLPCPQGNNSMECSGPSNGVSKSTGTKSKKCIMLKTLILVLRGNDFQPRLNWKAPFNYSAP